VLLIRCNANYHVITWCEMQTGIWMTYSDSTHFFDKCSYKILFISSFRSKDMNLARITHFLRFSEKQKRGNFLYRDGSSLSCWLAGPGDGAVRWLGTRLLTRHRLKLTTGSHLSGRKMVQKGIGLRLDGDSNSTPAEGGQRAQTTDAHELIWTGKEATYIT
jgi:hypothetical protein